MLDTTASSPASLVDELLERLASRRRLCVAPKSHTPRIPLRTLRTLRCTLEPLVAAHAAEMFTRAERPRHLRVRERAAGFGRVVDASL